ncbi:MAG: hypothetical protein QXO70_04195, partial [Candidatus Pacearchaeota archaeon]
IKNIDYFEDNKYWAKYLRRNITEEEFKGKLNAIIRDLKDDLEIAKNEAKKAELKNKINALNNAINNAKDILEASNKLDIEKLGNYFKDISDISKGRSILEIEPEEVKPTEITPKEIKPTEIKPTEIKPEEVKPIEIKPEEIKKEEAKPLEAIEEKKVEEVPKEIPAEEIKTEEKEKPKPIEEGAKITKVITPSGKEYNVKYALVDVKDLITSHNIDMSVNPEYPKEYQPRERQKILSKMQIEKIEKNLKPELLGENINASEGSPIITIENGKPIVLSGNARTIALKRKHNRGELKEYTEYLRANASKFGLKPEEITEGKILVRIKEGGVEDNIKFAREANESTVIGYSVAEKVKMMAKQIDIDDLEKIVNLENIPSGANNEFHKTIAKLIPDNEKPNYFIDKTPNKQFYDLATAVIFEKAYQNPKLLSLIAEEQDVDIANILNALKKNAVIYAKAQELNKEAKSEKINLVNDLTEAIELVRRARRQGIKVEELTRQKGLFEETNENANKLAVAINDNIRNSKTISAIFYDLGKRMLADIESKMQKGLFEVEKEKSNSELVDDVIKKVEKPEAESLSLLEELKKASEKPKKEPIPEIKAETKIEEEPITQKTEEKIEMKAEEKSEGAKIELLDKIRKNIIAIAEDSKRFESEGYFFSEYHEALTDFAGVKRKYDIAMANLNMTEANIRQMQKKLKGMNDPYWKTVLTKEEMEEMREERKKLIPKIEEEKKKLKEYQKKFEEISHKYEMALKAREICEDIFGKNMSYIQNVRKLLEFFIDVYKQKQKGLKSENIVIPEDLIKEIRKNHPEIEKALEVKKAETETKEAEAEKPVEEKKKKISEMTEEEQAKARKRIEELEKEINEKGTDNIIIGEEKLKNIKGKAFFKIFKPYMDYIKDKQEFKKDLDASIDMKLWEYIQTYGEKPSPQT